MNIREIVNECNGYLPIKCYDKIFNIAKNIKEGIIVEVGTAHAASSIIMSKSNSNIKIYTIDKIYGGSIESRFGSYDRNKEIINDNLNKFNANNVTFLPYDSISAASYIKEKDISLLFLDADGMIDRDLKLFLPKMKIGSKIIIDDYSNKAKLKRIKKLNVKVDLKHKLTFELTNLFIKENLLKIESKCNETIFCELVSKIDLEKINDKILNAYKKIVFSEGKLQLGIKNIFSIKRLILNKL